MLRKNWRGQEVVDEDAVFRHVLEVAQQSAKKFGMSMEQAEDIASDVALSLCARRDTLMQIIKEERDPRAYVRTVARNACLEFIKKERRQQWVRDSPKLRFDAMNKGGQNSPDTTAYVAGEVSVQQAINELEPELQIIMRMLIYQDMSLPKISAELGVPYRTVVGRRRRALKQLRKTILGDQGGTEAE